MHQLGHEQVLVSHDPSCGYSGIIAIHDTTLGPALGGTRFWRYAIDRRGDYRRLAAGAGDDLQVGGGGDQSRRRQVGDRRRQQAGRSRGALPRARPVRRNTGRTLHHCRRRRHQSRRHGVHQARDRPCRRPAGAVGRSVPSDGLWRVRRHQGRGAGAVGERPAQREDRRGPGVRATSPPTCAATSTARARSWSSPTSPPRRSSAWSRRPAPGRWTPDAIYDQPADVYAPCALGATINDDTIPQLKVEIIAGAANNQLAENRHGDRLEECVFCMRPTT